MKSSCEPSDAEAGDLVELSRQGYFAILLDENLRGLEPALEDEGVKVVAAARGIG